MKMLIKHGHVLDPETGLDAIKDILVEDGIITEIRDEIRMTVQSVIDADGALVMPGFIDTHVHLRDPGLTYKEDLTTGTNAAAAGGFTTICAMPNVKPVMDTGDKIAAFYERCKEEAVVNVIQFGAMTMGQEGEVLADLEGMAKAGCVGFSEDGKSVMDPGLCREAFAKAAELGIGIYDHCEDKNLVNGGVVNQEGAARRLGLPGISNEVEDSIARRDVEIAAATGARLHLCHCSTAGSVDIVRDAKERGLPVTAEVCPHHFTLTVDDIKEDDALFKMNPPLRTIKDVNALKRGLKEGIIDVIATDHAPHSAEEKDQSMLTAPFGITGLETCAALTNTELCEPGILTYMEMAEKLSFNPARILGIDKGRIQAGKAADIVIFDPNFEYTVRAENMKSKSKNSPFIGMKLRGRVLFTIVGGEIAYKAF